MIIACNCDVFGRDGEECADDADGTCTCLTGYDGVKCDDCAVNYYHDLDPFMGPICSGEYYCWFVPSCTFKNFTFYFK